MSNDTIYVLSATHNKGRETGSMYLKEPGPRLSVGLGTNLDEICTELTKAKVFYSRQDAWNALESAASSGWQITPISAKRLFTEKLKGT